MLNPTKEKISLTFKICLICIAVFFLRLIPPSMDILDLRELPGVLLYVLATPIALFDWITQGAFKPKAEGYIVFPSGAQFLFMVIADFVIFYLLACLWIQFRPQKQ